MLCQRINKRGITCIGAIVKFFVIGTDGFFAKTFNNNNDNIFIGESGIRMRVMQWRIDRIERCFVKIILFLEYWFMGGPQHAKSCILYYSNIVWVTGILAGVTGDQRKILLRWKAATNTQNNKHRDNYKS